MPGRFLVLALTFIGVLLTPALADDWVAAKLRGRVLQLVDNQWVPLERGDIVPDSRVVRTLLSGRVEFQRDAEVISLGPNTQIQIFDKAGKRFTTVKEHFGVVAIEAEVENVQHFAVDTPFLASVVKGTRFVVRSGKNGSSVKVLRGHVEVESAATHSTTIISKGQSATATATTELQVSGSGVLPPVIGPNGKAVSGKVADDAATLAKELAKAAAKASGDEAKALAKAANEAEQAANEGSKAKKDTAKDVAKAADKAETVAKADGKSDK